MYGENNPDQMTTIVTMPIYGKTPSNMLSRTDGQISTKLGIEQLCLKSI